MFHCLYLFDQFNIRSFCLSFYEFCSLQAYAYMDRNEKNLKFQTEVRKKMKNRCRNVILSNCLFYLNCDYDCNDVTTFGK